jgi:hypothetical protein
MEKNSSQLFDFPQDKYPQIIIALGHAAPVSLLSGFLNFAVHLFLSLALAVAPEIRPDFTGCGKSLCFERAGLQSRHKTLKDIGL